MWVLKRKSILNRSVGTEDMLRKTGGIGPRRALEQQALFLATWDAALPAPKRMLRNQDEGHQQELFLECPEAVTTIVGPRATRRPTAASSQGEGVPYILNLDSGTLSAAGKTNL